LLVLPPESGSHKYKTEFRLTSADAARLLPDEVFGRMAVYDLPSADRVHLLQAAAQDTTAGGRIYDAHIAEVSARSRGRRHRHG